MNRSIKQEASNNHLRASGEAHTIGDRRAGVRRDRESLGEGKAAVNPAARSLPENPFAAPDSQASRQAMPYWSAYLARLGQQVKQAARTELWPKVFAKRGGAGSSHESGRKTDTNHVAPRYRVRDSRGDRRMSPEQRRELMAQPLAQAPLRNMPYWFAYIARLGEQLKQNAIKKQGLSAAPGSEVSGNVGGARGAPQLWHAGQMDEGEVAAQRDQPAAPRDPVRRPIGDRRTGPRQRRNRAVQPDTQNSRTSSWSALLTWIDPVAELRRAPGGAEPIGVAPIEDSKPRYSRFLLGIWAYYFIAKLALFGMDLIAFHPLENIAFAAFILFPVASRFLRRAKGVITLVLALALLYYDSWLPSIGRVMSQASLLSNFSFSYLIELIARFVSLPVLGVLAAVSLAYWILSRRLNMGALIMAGMLGLWVVLSPVSDFVVRAFNGSENRVEDKAMPDMDKAMQAFFAGEAKRSVLFAMPKANAVPFDVIFIHVCSMSWDDVRSVGLEQHPLWQRFDFLFKNFNSAASYSGPAAIRLLRATCGQQEHGKMYSSTVPEKCYLMNSLLRSGFEPELALNHDGKFDDFLGQVQTAGRLTVPPMTLDGLEVVQQSFDGAPVYDDLSVLNRWLELRKKSVSPRVALYYNTVSMHDGNHLPDTHSNPNSLETYKARLTDFLDRTEQFMKSLDESGRRAVVVMIPEHGGAVRGDKKQIAGLREIPTPNITRVPVGIKVIGGNVQREGGALSIDQPASYLAISHVVKRMLEKSPFTANSFSPSDYVEDLPVTPFVAQNEQMTVAEYEHGYYLGRGPSQWESYTEFNTPAGEP